MKDPSAANYSHIYPLLSLYDTLNDDDDDIRDLGAQTVSKLLKRSLVPLAAQLELVEYIKHLYGGRAAFQWSAACRMTGHTFQNLKIESHLPTSARVQFCTVLKENDSLFIEEEQNLFIDEIREARIWSNAFKDVDLGPYTTADINTLWEPPFSALTSWVEDGLSIMMDLLIKEDGPLGWASKPAVFALCMRVILSAKTIIQCNSRIISSGLGRGVHPEVERIASVLRKFKHLAQEKRVHGGLLSEI